MELDFKTVRALSSPTRIKILSEVLSKETTTTDLSRELDKTKSTVSSHLNTLVEAKLVEKDAEEGRRRVIYKPTRKAEAIIEGKERKVKFSLGSSALSALAGVALGFQVWKNASAQKTAAALDTASQVGTMTAMESTKNSGQAATDPSTAFQFSSEILLALGLGMLGLSAVMFMYGFTVKKLSDRESVE